MKLEANMITFVLQRTMHDGNALRHSMKTSSSNKLHKGFPAKMKIMSKKENQPWKYHSKLLYASFLFNIKMHTFSIIISMGLP